MLARLQSSDRGVLLDAPIPAPSLRVADSTVGVGSLPSVGDAALALLRHYLRLFGSHPIAYSTLQPGMSYFVRDPIGFVAYARPHERDSSLVLGDPVCDLSMTGNLLHDFVAEHPRCCFFEVGHATAEHLSRMGFFVNEMGVETTIELEGLSFTGASSEYVRRALNEAKRRGITVQECGSAGPLQDQATQLARRWVLRNTRDGRELRFLVRPMVEYVDPEVRMFVATIEAQVIGMVLFDPIYADSRAIGYFASVLRSDVDAPPRTRVCILAHAAMKFQAEGRQVLSLGLSPFYRTRFDPAFDGSRFTFLLSKLLFHSGRVFYPAKDVAFHKSRFHAREQKVYFATKRKNAFREVWNAMRVTGLVGNESLMSSRASEEVASG